MEKKVFDSLEIHRLDKFSFSMFEDKKLQITYVNDSYNINIIAYGKSFEYYLKYILFILGTQNNNIPFINITFFSDENTYQHIKNSITPFVLSDNVIIRFVHSSHLLMSGIGAKRAMIQKLMVSIGADYGMSIDDNIISLHNHYSTEGPPEFQTNYRCTKRNILAANVCSHCNKTNTSVTQKIYRSRSRSRSRSTTQKMFKKQKVSGGELSILQKREILAGCTEWNMIELYDYIKNNAPKDWWVVGVAKGDGYPDESVMRDPKVIFKNTTSVYKLAYMNYKKLETQGIRYNPYYTTFLEDVTFNANTKLENHIGVCSKIQLRFAHSWPDNCAKMDYNDCYDPDPDFMNVSVFKPVFFTTYLKELRKQKLALEGYETDKHKYIKIGKDLVSTGSGKYSHLHLILILLYMLKYIRDPQLLHVANFSPNYFKAFVDYGLLEVDCDKLYDGKEYPFIFTELWKTKLQSLLDIESTCIKNINKPIDSSDSTTYSKTINELKELNTKIQTQVNSPGNFIQYRNMYSSLQKCMNVVKKRKR